MLIAFAAGVALTSASVAVLGVRRAGPFPEAARGAAGAIVIQLPPEARMRLVREQGLAYALEVDDTVRITGVSVTQMARVAASVVMASARAGEGSGPTDPGRSVADRAG